MKNKFIQLWAVCSLLFFVTVFTSWKKPTSNNNSATVEQEQGIFIFIKSKPISEYQYLGSVSKSIALSGSPDEMLKSLIKKCKKEYPGADGIIFTSNDMDKADCIKFK